MKLEDRLRDFRWFAERFFHIRDRYGKIIPFRLNALQLDLDESFTGKDDVLKARQGGCSTLIVLRMLHRCLINSQQRAVILAHEARSARQLMAIAELALDHMPDQLRPRLDVNTRAEKKIGGLGSTLICATARNPDIGRGGSINMLLCSEIAAWEDPRSTLAAIGPSLGPGSMIVRESTARGAGNYWHQQWIRSKNGLSGYKPHFYPWWIEPAYACPEPDPTQDPDEFEADGAQLPFTRSALEAELGLAEAQLRWRRRKKRELGPDFAQEYAEDDLTCFLTSGRGVFDNRMIQSMYETLVARGPMVEEDPSLGLKVFMGYSRKERRLAEFVIGADTSEGIADPGDPTSDGDYSAASVLDRRTGVQVATVRGSWEPYEFGRILNKIGHKFYDVNGPALLGVERNKDGTAVLSELHRHLGYSRLYWSTHFDAKKQRSERRLGWVTSSVSRPIMVSDLVHALTKGHLVPLDPEFLAECLTFVRDRSGRPGAQSGCHDDLVVATAIAQQLRLAPEGAPLMAMNFF